MREHLATAQPIEKNASRNFLKSPSPLSGMLARRSQLTTVLTRLGPFVSARASFGKTRKRIRFPKEDLDLH